jgi:hypothetical protein
VLDAALRLDYPIFITKLKKKQHMKNPFDFEKERTQFEIFYQLTQAIDKWMVEKYPTMVSDLDKRISEINKVHNAILTSFSNHKQAVINDKKETRDYIIGEINKYLKETHPMLDTNLTLVAEDLKKFADKLSKNGAAVEKKLEKVIQNSSIYEDVYKIRDEMKEVSKFIGGFKKKISKAFEI